MEMKENTTNRGSWLRHGKYCKPRPAGCCGDDLMDYHCQLVCVILPSPFVPKASAPHLELLQIKHKNGGWNLQLSAVPGSQLLVWCAHWVTLVSCWWPQETWGDLDDLQKSVPKIRGQYIIKDSTSAFCFTFPVEWLKWRYLSWTRLSSRSINQAVRTGACEVFRLALQSINVLQIQPICSSKHV